MSQSIHDTYRLPSALELEMERRRRQALEEERRRREAEERRRREEQERRRREEEERKHREAIAGEKARGSWAARFEEVVRAAREAAAEDDRRQTPSGTERKQAEADQGALKRLIQAVEKAIDGAPKDVPRSVASSLERARQVARDAKKEGARDPGQHRQFLEAALRDLEEVPRRMAKEGELEDRRRRRAVAKAVLLLSRLAVVESNSPLPVQKREAAALIGRIEEALNSEATDMVEAVGGLQATVEALEAAFDVAHRMADRRRAVLQQVKTALERLGYDVLPIPGSDPGDAGAVAHVVCGGEGMTGIRAVFGLDGSVRFDALLDDTPDAATQAADERSVRAWCQAYDHLRQELAELGFEGTNHHRFEPPQAGARLAAADSAKRRPRLTQEERRLLQSRGGPARQRRR